MASMTGPGRLQYRLSAAQTAPVRQDDRSRLTHCFVCRERIANRKGETREAGSAVRG